MVRKKGKTRKRKVDDFSYVRGDKLYRNVDNAEIGEKQSDGRWQGPHPWGECMLIAPTPEELRNQQRALA